MREQQRRSTWILFGALIAAVAIAAFLWWLRPATAEGIRRDPDAFRGRTVTLAGTVAGGASIGGALFGGGKGAFLLDDGTGQIAVTTDGLAPSKGQRVTVRGRVEVIASLSIPDSWLRAVGVPANSPAGGGMSAVVVHAEQVRER